MLLLFNLLIDQKTVNTPIQEKRNFCKMPNLGPAVPRVPSGSNFRRRGGDFGPSLWQKG